MSRAPVSRFAHPDETLAEARGGSKDADLRNQRHPTPPRGPHPHCRALARRSSHGSGPYQDRLACRERAPPDARRASRRPAERIAMPCAREGQPLQRPPPARMSQPRPSRTRLVDRAWRRPTASALLFPPTADRAGRATRQASRSDARGLSRRARGPSPPPRRGGLHPNLVRLEPCLCRGCAPRPRGRSPRQGHQRLRPKCRRGVRQKPQAGRSPHALMPTTRGRCTRVPCPAVPSPRVATSRRCGGR